MKVGMEDGIVVCSMEDRNRRFLKETCDCFEGFYNGKLKIHLYIHPASSDYERAKEEARILDKILLYAAENGVEVDEAVRERLSGFKAILERERARYEEERKAREQSDKWDRLCRKGCGGCKHLAVCGDDHYCRVSGDLLREKNIPANIKGVHYMFNYQAFPSENCLYKI